MQAEPEYRTKASDMRYFFVRNKANGETLPLSDRVDVGRLTDRSTPTASTCFAPPRSRALPRPGTVRTRRCPRSNEVAAEVLPTNMSYAWNAMSFQEKAAAGTGPSYS